MSILIKGMDMPSNCIECPFCDGEYGTCDCMKDCRVGGADEKPDWCPLEEVPTQDSRSKTLDALDCISRQAAIDAADRADYTGLAIEDVKRITDEVVKEIKQLPSAQPEITEKDVKKYCRKRCLVVLTSDLYAEMKERWSSVQPDIIACGDCKHWINHDRRCGYWNHGVRIIDWCSRAERREDEQTYRR